MRTPAVMPEQLPVSRAPPISVALDGATDALVKSEAVGPALVEPPAGREDRQVVGLAPRALACPLEEMAAPMAGSVRGFEVAS